MDTTLHLLQQAKIALQAGQPSDAKAYVRQAVQQDPQNYMVWLWLAQVTPSPEKALRCLQRAEQLEPGHPHIAKTRALLEEKTTQVLPAQPLPAATAATGRHWQTAVLRASMVALMALVLAGACGLLWLQLDNRSSNTAVVLAAAQQPAAPAAVAPQPTATATAVALAAKQLEPHLEARAQWTATPTPSPTPSPTPTVIATFVSWNYTSSVRPIGVEADERWIDVNLSTQRLTAYEGDTAVFTTLISSGTANHPTVTGQFRIWLEFRSQTMDGARLGYDYYLEDVPYVMYFYEDYAIHGTYWHSNFGTPMSHGCINMETSEAGWIYNWASLGTMVNVHY